MVETIGLKKEILNRIDETKDDLIALCSDVIKIPSDNPPGDTTQLAEFLKKYLEDKEICVEIYEPMRGNPNIVATMEGSKKGPHMILLAHMDQFLAEVGEPWGFPPYSGEVKGGRILGRGASDMKGGLAALTYCFIMIKEMEVKLPGKLTLCLVSDEETAGGWGAGWLVDNVPGLIGDACLNAEPSNLSIGLGQKGWYPMRLRTTGKPAHGSRGRLAGENAILKMMKVLPILLNFENIEGRFNEEIEEMVKKITKVRPGSERSLRYISVNIAVIKGGTKHNIVPATCELECDMRLPWGVTLDEVTNKLEKELREAVPDISIEYIYQPSTLSEGSYTSPKEKIVEIMVNNVVEITGKKPLLGLSSGASDSRFFMFKGVPSINCGPGGGGMARADEYVTVESLIAATKVNAATVIDFLCGK